MECEFCIYDCKDGSRKYADGSCDHFESTMLHKAHINASIFGVPLKIVESNENEFECIVECNNCGNHIKYGKTLMISGFIGCPNCFDDLRERVLDAKLNNHELYMSNDLLLHYSKNKGN